MINEILNYINEKFDDHKKRNGQKWKLKLVEVNRFTGHRFAFLLNNLKFYSAVIDSERIF